MGYDSCPECGGAIVRVVDFDLLNGIANEAGRWECREECGWVERDDQSD